MRRIRRRGWRSSMVALGCLGAVLAARPAPAADPIDLRINRPLSPPTWALLERELIRASSRACLEYYDRYFDARGYLLCVERWGGDDGPDDAIENLCGWPILHALGAPDSIRQRYETAWEGHLRQYTTARTTEVVLARDGMYYKEFPVMFDWLHHGEGLTVFDFLGLSNPRDPAHIRRARRFAGFYLGEDPGAPNYDRTHRIIRSFFNGSRGPLLRDATAAEWAGDPIEVAHRFKPRHGESSYQQMLDHFKDYGKVVGDHPQNLGATTLAFNAFLLTGDPKYRAWILEYVDAWRQRMIENGGIIPTSIGLDGKISKDWYGGVYGWGFSVVDPVTGKLVHRNHHELGLIGFGIAYLLTGDDRYLDVWRKQIDLVNGNRKVVDGRTLYPHMHGKDGWYEFTPTPYNEAAEELWYWSMRADDRRRVENQSWVSYLDGKNPELPESWLRADLAEVGRRVAAFRADETTPDTRLADDPMPYNPAVVRSLVPLMLGGLDPSNRRGVLHARVRYFDPEGRRAGVPDDVAVLVERLTADETVLMLVNVNPSDARTLVIQGGAFGEHLIQRVTVGEERVDVDRPYLTVQLDPGAGGRLTLAMRRYASTPSLQFPWAPREPHQRAQP